MHHVGRSQPIRRPAWCPPSQRCPMPRPQQQAILVVPPTATVVVIIRRLDLIFLLLVIWKKGAVSFAAASAACFFCVFLFFLFKIAISLAPTIVSAFPSADPALVCCIASTEAIHIVLSDAFLNAPFFCYFCIADVPCDFSSTKETCHWALYIQIAARFAVCPIAMSLLSAARYRLYH
jgi:hypothetical protein